MQLLREKFWIILLVAVTLVIQWQHFVSPCEETESQLSGFFFQDKWSQGSWEYDTPTSPKRNTVQKAAKLDLSFGL